MPASACDDAQAELERARLAVARHHADHELVTARREAGARHPGAATAHRRELLAVELEAHLADGPARLELERQRGVRRDAGALDAELAEGAAQLALAADGHLEAAGDGGAALGAHR